MFQDILGRLNGKSKEESERDQSQRSTVQRSAFIHHRWGRLHFISGGLLAGDELQKLPKMGCANIQPNEAGLSTEEKGTNGTMAGHNNSRPEVGKSKKRKKSKLFEQRERQSGSNKNSSSMLSSESFNEFSGNGDSSPPEARLDDAGVAGKSDKTQRRGEKVERRLQRKLRREARQVARRETSDSPAALASSESRDSRLLDDREERRRTSTVSEGVHGSKRPLGVASGRMAVRRRYIEHKKMSMMDSKALNEVG